MARVEKQTFVCTEKKEDTIPSSREGVDSKLGNWKSPAEMDAELEYKFPGSMRGEKTIGYQLSWLAEVSYPSSSRKGCDMICVRSTNSIFLELLQQFLVNRFTYDLSQYVCVYVFCVCVFCL